MSWTKRQLITQAYEEIGYAGYVYDLEPEQLQSALRRLDAMVATWNSKGVYIGYPLPSSPELADLDEETETPDWAAEAIALNLAIRIAPTVGKAVSMETKASARSAYNEILRRSAAPRNMKYPSTLPVGAGNKSWSTHGDPFILPEDDGTVLPPDKEVNFTNG